MRGMIQLSSKDKTRNGYLNLSAPFFYKLYRNEKKLKHPPIPSLTIYREVLNFLFSRIWYYMIVKNWVYQPPLKLGEFYIAESLTSKGYYKDWTRIKKKGKTSKSYNFHTNGRVFYVKWNKQLSKFKNKKSYLFKPIRGDKDTITGKRGLAGWIKKCSTDSKLKDFRGQIF